MYMFADPCFIIFDRFNKSYLLFAHVTCNFNTYLYYLYRVKLITSTIGADLVANVADICLLVLKEGVHLLQYLNQCTK